MKLYIWFGHVIGGDAAQVSDDAFFRLRDAFDEGTLDERVDVQPLADGSLAVSSAIVRGESFMPIAPAHTPESDDAYHDAMDLVYGIVLPPSRLMCGCA